VRAKPFEAQATLLRLLLTKSDDCIEWPHTVNSRGYGQIGVDGKSTSVHVIACEHHHGPRPEGMQVAHACGNRRCVNRVHIRWATPSENELDKRLTGTAPIGERNGRAKLTAAQVAEIRRRRTDGQTAKVLAAEFGMSIWAISAISRGESWRDLRSAS